MAAPDVGLAALEVERSEVFVRSNELERSLSDLQVAIMDVEVVCNAPQVARFDLQPPKSAL